MEKPSSAIDPALPPAAESDAFRPARAPLLWALLGLIGGYLAALFGPALPPATATAVAAALLFGAFRGQRRPWFWGPSFVLLIALLGHVWWTLRNDPPPAIWDELPPRELTAEIAVEHLFTGSPYPNRRYGFVRVLAAPPVMAELVGRRLYGSFREDAASPVLASGAHYTVRGVLAPVDRAVEGDFAQFLEQRQTRFRLRQGEVYAELRPPPSWQQGRVLLHRRWATLLTRAPPARDAEARLLGAMILGDRDLLDAAQRQAFLLSGTMHLFAISGLHVMVAALTLRQLMVFLPVSEKVRFFTVLSILAVYVVTTGSSPSALRAFSMVAFTWLAIIANRPARPVPAILASALVVLLIAPAQLLSTGFQLSYAVVLSILLLGLPLGRFFVERHEPFRWVLRSELRWWQRAWVSFRKRGFETLCISFAATLGSAPLIVLHFEVWTPGAVPLNGLLVPLASVVVAIGILMLLLEMIGLAGVAGFIAHAAWLILWIMQRLVGAAVQIPGFFTERAWMFPTFAFLSLGGFLFLLFAIHEDRWCPRLRPFVRLSLPVLFVLLALALGTAAI